MNAYTSLARFYDSLTADVPYAAFADFYETLFADAGLRVRTILDIACGTGSMTCELALRGYEMIGADPSPDMLSTASQKAEFLETAPVFICQAMESLDLYGTVEAAVCSLDGVNYVCPDVLPEAFRRIRLFLEPGGIFIFDINTPSMLRSLDGEVFLDETDEVFCVWRAEFVSAGNGEDGCGLSAERRHESIADRCGSPAERRYKNVYGMDIFAKTGKLWTRSREEHVEYAYEPEELAELLRKTGFTDVRLYGELTLDAPKHDEQRVFIAARK